MLKRWIYWLVGGPPASGDTREARLRWARRFYRLNLLFIVLLALLALSTGGVFLWIVVAITAVLSAGGFAATSHSIRRASSHHASRHDRR